MYKRRWILHGHHSRQLSAQKELIKRKTLRKPTEKEELQSIKNRNHHILQQITLIIELKLQTSR